MIQKLFRAFGYWINCHASFKGRIIISGYREAAAKFPGLLRRANQLEVIFFNWPPSRLFHVYPLKLLHHTLSEVHRKLEAIKA